MKRSSLVPLAPSPKRERRAIAAYGGTITDPRLLRFAEVVASGENPSTAWLTVNPGASEGMAKRQGGLLMAHPQIRFMVACQRMSLPKYARTLAPVALQRLGELALGEHDAPPSVQAKAIDSILDRAGLPRTSNVHVDAVADVESSVTDILEGEVVEGHETPRLTR